MDNLVYCLTNLLFSVIPVLYYCIIFRSSIIFYLVSGDIDLSFGISLSRPIFSGSFVTVFKPSCGEVIKILKILSAVIVDQITSFFCCFLNYFLEAVFTYIFTGINGHIF